MIRVGTLTDAALLEPDETDNKLGMSPAEQLQAIFAQTRSLAAQKDEVYQLLMRDLTQEHGIEQLDPETLDGEKAEYLERYFTHELMPMLSPQIIDKHHPFPFLRNKEIYICAQLQTKGEFVKLAMIPVSTGFDRMVFLPFAKDKFVLIEDLVLKYCDKVFESYVVTAKTILRVTRNADINVDEAMYDHDIDYRSVMEQMVKNRRKLMPVRLQIQGGANHAILDQLCKKLELSHDRVFQMRTPLDMSFGFSLCARYERRGEKELFYPTLTPQKSVMLEHGKPIMPQIEDHDVLLSYPFETMKPFIDLLLEAASDESVLSIKMTLYRVARQSQVVAALIKAAENGKEVHVVVELRARFDEENNIIWSRRLEEAGVNLTYGLGEYKVHSKLLVITRKQGDKVQFITQIGTGNYNESTARQYTDLCLITADREFGEDGLRIFNGILTDHPAETTTHLLASPLTMKPAVLRYIEQEIRYAREGQPAEILVKVNSVTDKDLIDALIEASKAGVVSIVGRFLEHSRVDVFGPPERSHMYISSADFMTRNMERRVEVAAPIYNEQLKQRIMAMLNLEFSDNVKGKRLLENGEYQLVKNDKPPIDSQIDLYKAAYMRAEHAANPPKSSQKPSAPKSKHAAATKALKKRTPTQQQARERFVLDRLRDFFKKR